MFQFYFQDGNLSPDNFQVLGFELKDIIGGILASLFTVFLFFLGLRYEKKREKQKEIEHLRSIKITFLVLLQSLVESLEQQADAYKKFLTFLDLKNSENFTLELKAIYNLHVIESIPFTDIFNSLVIKRENQDQIKHFNQIFKHLAIVKAIGERGMDEFKRFVKDYNDFQIIWNTEVNNLRKILDLVVRSTRNKTLTDKNHFTFLSEMDRIYYSWQQLENRNNFIVMNSQLLNPLLALSKKYDYVEALEFTNYILSAQQALNNLERTLSLYRKVYTNNEERFREAVANITQSSKFFQNDKTFL